MAEARNNAVHQIITPLVIVADADAIPDVGAVHAALANEDGVTWPFTQYRHIPNEYALKPDLMTAPIDRTYRNTVGGCFITHTDHYWELGGMDEQFDRRWGYEDNAFADVVNTLSTMHRIPGNPVLLQPRRRPGNDPRQPQPPPRRPLPIRRRHTTTHEGTDQTMNLTEYFAEPHATMATTANT